MPKIAQTSISHIAAGDVFELGQSRLMCGDCQNPTDVSVLFNGASPSVLVVDPDYSDAELVAWRPSVPSADTYLVFSDHRRFAAQMARWPAEFRQFFVWDCLQSTYIKNWPLIRSKYCLWFGGGTYNHRGAYYGEYQPPRRMKNKRGEYLSPGRNKGKHLATVFSSPISHRDCMAHPHSKPLDWIRLLIGNCTTGLVYDPFGGSGTTLLACQQLERPCVMMEKEPHYVALIIARFEELFGIPARRVD